MNTALVIVDMLRDFVDGRLANPAVTPTIKRIGALAEAARRRQDWIVVYGNDAHHPGDVELRLFGEHAHGGNLKGAQTRSCSVSALIEETAEQVASMHSALLLLANDRQAAGLIWRL